MARLPKLRLNFDADVQYLLRMKHAVEEDRGYPEEFRDMLVGKIVELQRVLTNAPKRSEGTSPKANAGMTDGHNSKLSKPAQRSKRRHDDK